MSFDFSSPVFLVGLICILLFAGYYYFFIRKKKPKSDNKEPELLDELDISEQDIPSINCMIIDDLKKTIYPGLISENEGAHIISKYGSLGPVRYWEGIKVLWFWKYLDYIEGIVQLKPVLNSHNIKYPSTQLHWDVTQPELKMIAKEALREDQGFLQQYWHFLWLIIAAGVLLFIWSQA